MIFQDVRTEYGRTVILIYMKAHARAEDQITERRKSMRILLIRHGDPDYENDSLTEKGRREAELLAHHLKDERIDEAFVSTMGRAVATAEPTLKIKGMTASYCDWLREFSERTINRPDRNDKEKICWDWLPQDWTTHEEFYRYDEWYNNPIMAEVNMKEYQSMVTDALDRLLAEHGYERDGHMYRAVRPNDDTLALFCHFGVGCIILGHLIGVSPMPLWHGLCAAPTSVSTIYTEERREGIASFRMACFGDTTHLYKGNEPVSLSARFCEMYTNMDERHD